jgi:hypothetical protein
LLANGWVTSAGAVAERGSPASWLLQSAQRCVSGANLRPTMLFVGASLLAICGRRGYDAAAEGGSPASWLLQRNAEMRIRRGTATHHAFRRSELARDLVGDVVTAQRPRAVRQQTGSYRAQRCVSGANLRPTVFFVGASLLANGWVTSAGAVAERGSAASWLLQRIPAGPCVPKDLAATKKPRREPRL